MDVRPIRTKATSCIGIRAAIAMAKIDQAEAEPNLSTSAGAHMGTSTEIKQSKFARTLTQLLLFHASAQSDFAAMNQQVIQL